MTNTTYLHTAITAAIAAGKEIMKIYATDFDVAHKNDDSPLTVADKNANAIIMSYLKKYEVPIISEENKQTEYKIRKTWDRCWIVDPLDGTKEFVKRNGEFTVNIALVENGNPVLGVIYVPVTKTLYYTAADASVAFKYILLDEEEVLLDEIITAAEMIKPSEKDPATLKIVGSRSHLNEETSAFISEKELNHSVEIVSKGSSLKFCLVAEGEAHLYPRYAPTMEWDTAAGQAICQAVGVQVLDNTTGKPMRYNKENLLNSHFLVTL